MLEVALNEKKKMKKKMKKKEEKKGAVPNFPMQQLSTGFRCSVCFEK